MTHLIKTLSKIGIPAAALTLSVFGLAAGSDAHSSNGASPVDCEISITKGRYGYTYEGIVHASETANGTYELKINKRGSAGSAMISQSGDFSLRAGASETVGQATFGGLPPSSVNAELSIRWNGQTLACDNSTDL
jgi:hypothetical protein